MQMVDMFYKELEDAKKRKVPFVIPIGTIEYHAHHASCGTDTMVINGVMRELEKTKEMVVCPPIWYGVASYEKFITPEYVMEGSNSLDHTSVQTMFLNGKAAMMYTGSWLANEMKGVGGVEKFPMMKTPVISAILDKLETVKTETELRNLISAIDSVTDGEKALSDFAEGENYKVDVMITLPERIYKTDCVVVEYQPEQYVKIEL